MPPVQGAHNLPLLFCIRGHVPTTHWVSQAKTADVTPFQLFLLQRSTLTSKQMLSRLPLKHLWELAPVLNTQVSHLTLALYSFFVLVSPPPFTLFTPPLLPELSFKSLRQVHVLPLLLNTLKFQCLQDKTQTTCLK